MATTAVTVATPGVAQNADDTLGAVNTRPVAPTEILAILPFSLAEPYAFTWRKDQPMVKGGSLVALRFDPKLLIPRNSAEQVLYAGNTTVQKLNFGDKSGVVIGIVPGDVDLSREAVWLGRPGLPEQVTDESIRIESALAKDNGIKALDGPRVQSITSNRVESSDLATFLRTDAAEFVLKYSPEDKDLAAQWRLPEATK